jgi:hypothetical protein
MYRVLYGEIIRRTQAIEGRRTGVGSPNTHVFLIHQHLVIAERRVPVYHVALLGECMTTGARRVYEHGPVATRTNTGAIGDAVLTQLPPVVHTLDDIATFEATLPKTYLLGIRDCRHHVRDLLSWCYDL